MEQTRDMTNAKKHSPPLQHTAPGAIGIALGIALEGDDSPISHRLAICGNLHLGAGHPVDSRRPDERKCQNEPGRGTCQAKLRSVTDPEI